MTIYITMTGCSSELKQLIVHVQEKSAWSLGRKMGEKMIGWKGKEREKVSENEIHFY